MDEFANYGLPNLVSMQEHKPHAVQKRMISHVYSKSYLQNSQDLVTLSHVLLFDRLLPFFDSAAHDGTPVEVLEFFQAVNMDFMSAYLFGIANGTDFMRDVKARKHYIRMYQTKLLRLPGADVASKYLESHCLYMCNAAEKYIQTPEKNSSHVPMTNPVVYSQLSSQKAKIQDPSDPPNSNHLAVASEMLDHLLAGRETSAITLTYLMHELSRRPAIQSALRSELLTLSPPILYTNNTSSLPHPQTIDALPLLNAILQETLRRYAANPAPQPRLTPSGATIEGYTNIPAGVRISTAAYCLHRNAEVFPDPDAWKPERWLQGDQKKGGGTEEMRRWFWAFGSGGKMCIGSNFALQGTLLCFKVGFWKNANGRFAVMKLLVATVYTNYATTIVDDEGIEQADSYLAGPVGNKLVLKFHRVS